MKNIVSRTWTKQVIRKMYFYTKISAYCGYSLVYIQIFTKLDLCSTYNKIQIQAGDESITKMGQFEYLVMPYGFANSPSIFQSFTSGIFADMNRFMIIYIDNILVYSSSPEEHIQHVQKVLQRLHKNHLFIIGEECEFHKTLSSFSFTRSIPGGGNGWRESESCSGLASALHDEGALMLSQIC